MDEGQLGPEIIGSFQHFHGTGAGVSFAVLVDSDICYRCWVRVFFAACHASKETCTTCCLDGLDDQLGLVRHTVGSGIIQRGRRGSSAFHRYREGQAVSAADFQVLAPFLSISGASTPLPLKLHFIPQG